MVEKDAGALVAAIVTAATAGAAAGGAVAELVEAVPAWGAGITGKAVTVALEAGFPSSRTATGAAAGAGKLLPVSLLQQR